jgi:hypothetical protein
MHSRFLGLLALAFIPACARSHTHAPLADAGVHVDAHALGDAPLPTRCAEGRREWVIPAPAPTRANHENRLLSPRVNAAGERVSASVLVMRNPGGGMGVSELRTFARDGSDPHAHFESETPYLIGTRSGLEDYLGSGGFTRGRLWGELRRFDAAYFSVLGANDEDSALEDVPIEVSIASEVVLSRPVVELAREGTRAVFVHTRVGVVEYRVEAGALERIGTTHAGEVIMSDLFSPRLSPSGRMLAMQVMPDPARAGREDHAVVFHDFDTGTARRFDFRIFPRIDFVAFLDDARLLMMDRSDDRSLLVMSVADGSMRRVDIGLPNLEPQHATDAFDVSADGETFVISEDEGRQLRVVHCDPALRALASR